VVSTIGGALLLAVSPANGATETSSTDEDPLHLPVPGTFTLRVLTPTVLELESITTGPPADRAPDLSRILDSAGKISSGATQRLKVTVDGRPVPVRAVGFKRRPLYAPIKKRDLRVGNYLYVQLTDPLTDKAAVKLANPDGDLWVPPQSWEGRMEPLRLNPAIHVNQVGYLPEQPKKAMVGFYLGSLGELEIPAATDFQVIERVSGKTIYRGRLSARPDAGFSQSAYQRVWEADFSAVTAPGEYRLIVAGLGGSFPFFINEKIAGAFARAYALGLYHQRCGTTNALPFTRFVHDACHTAPAEIPTAQFKMTGKFLAEDTADAGANPRHTAPRLQSVQASLYPFQRQGKIDVSGGHHDAGDYSKYTIDSAGLIHALVFAADVFPGAGELDNLGIPESGDGKSDLLQEARWEAEFLAKMQDTDGGFYFLVYPRERRYENNVLPEDGDPQVVWPKNTSATAAAVAALAQCASSPRFRQQFPQEAKRYLESARRGWSFLTRAIAAHGRDGAYQKLTHYGDEFMHDDELAWAACELFLATGDKTLHDQLRTWLKPNDPLIRKWGWWRMDEGYGCAIRSYAFAAKSGRIPRGKLDRAFLAQCEAEVEAAGNDVFQAARQNAYGTSFPAATKRQMNAGWYFSLDRAFDLAAACQLDYPTRMDRRPEFLEAIFSNLNYEAGNNPVNVCFVTGLGWRRQREIVHHYAQNDRRVLPPSGLPIGNIQAGFNWMPAYGTELSALCYPSDNQSQAPYPLYDRWSDSFNPATGIRHRAARPRAGDGGLSHGSLRARVSIRVRRCSRKSPACRPRRESINLSRSDSKSAGGIF